MTKQSRNNKSQYNGFTSWLNPSLLLSDCAIHDRRASASTYFPSAGMDKLHDAVAWYQKKIGYNDKQLWEQSVEMKLQKGPPNVRNAPRKSVRLKTEFIDVDLIRGSTFSKAKPKVSWTAITGNAIIRILLLPVFFRWWVQQSSWLFFLFLLYLYSQQIFTMVVYFRTVGEITEDELALSEVMMPPILMMILALVHSQTVVSHFSHKPPHRDHNKLNRSFSKSKKRVNKVTIPSNCQKSADNSKSNASTSSSQSTKNLTSASSTSADKKTKKKNLPTNKVTRIRLEERDGSIDDSRAPKSNIKSDIVSGSVNTVSSLKLGDQLDVDSENSTEGVTLPNGHVELKEAKALIDNGCEGGVLEEEFSSLGSESHDLHSREITHRSQEEENFADTERISDEIHSESENESKSINIRSGKMCKDDLEEEGAVGVACSQSESSHLELTRHLSDLARKSLPEFHNEDATDEDEKDLDNKASSSGTLLRRRRRISANKSADLGEIARTRVVPKNLGLWSSAVNNGVQGSSSDNETTPGPATPEPGTKMTMSSEEWDDRIQSDVSTSSYSSSCGSEGELSDSGETQMEFEELHKQGWTTSNLHVINLLQPPTTSSTANNHIPPPDKVSCVMWEGNECKKVDLTALDIGWAIIDKVDNMQESSDYILVGLLISGLLAFMPLVFRFYHMKQTPALYTLAGLYSLVEQFQDNPWRRNLFAVNGIMQRLCLCLIFFFLLSVADRTFKQRLLYAKHFCYLTSSRRARKFDMPHFRLSKVRNIKTWLSLRSYLKRRGPQRSVDVIVSATFLLAICIVTLMCLQMLKDADTYLDFECNWELVVWCLALGVYLMRFMTLGLKINKKYRNLSVLITEQINLYLQMEQKPHKKEELMLANNVLKLAEELLKELESPFKISGFSANPMIYNITKVVVLSAFSAVLTELLGFKLKLYKIKFKA